MNEETRYRSFRALVRSLASTMVVGTLGCSGSSASTSLDASAPHDDGTDSGWPQGSACADYPRDVPDAAPFWDGGPLVRQDDDDTDAGPDGAGPAGPCTFQSPLPCDAPQRYGWLSYDECTRYCSPISEGNCQIENSGHGPVLECMLCGGGRRPEGFELAGALTAASPLAAYLQGMTALEAASVPAFERLFVELGMHGAPRAILRDIRRAIREECRHARTMHALAARHLNAETGVAPRLSLPAPITRRRSAFAIALENAVEGCVRETYGALVATWQGAMARDADVASAMQTIAREETRHAALAWRVHRWLAPRLTIRQERRVRTSLYAAVAELEAAACAAPPAELVVGAGLPPPRVARAMLAELRRTVWA
jgi:hypothetical protein